MGVSFASLPGLTLLGGIASATAQTIASGFESNRLPQTASVGLGTSITADGRTLDGIGGPVTLPFEVNYFGKSYSQIFVNNHGNLTFESASANFIPVGVGASYQGQPIIAPFYADTDTRNPASGVLGFGNGTYQGRTAFGATWPSVGYFASQADKLNTFQAILASRADTGAGNFDIYFNYGSIKWECSGSGGQGGTNGLCTPGSSPPSAGFSAGTGVAGTYYELPGSLVPGAFLDGGANALATSSNNGVPGQFLFPVRNGSVVIANVCSAGDNAASTNVANCGPSRTYDQRIFYQPTGNFTLNVLNDTTIATTANGESAVLLMPTSATGAAPSNTVTLNVASSATIRSATRSGVEIDGSAGSGAVTVNNAGTIAGASSGVYARSGTGALNIANQGSITGAFGIVTENTRLTTINNAGSLRGGVGAAVSAAAASLTNTGTVTFGQVGLAATTATGITLTNSGTIRYDATIPAALTPENLALLPPSVAALDQTLRTSFGASGAPLPAIAVAALTQGTLTLNNSGTVTTAPTGIGIAAAASGAIALTNSGTVTGGTTGLALQAGAAASGEVPARAGQITLVNSGQVTAAQGVALLARTFGGPLSIANSGSISGLTGIMTMAGSGALTVSNAATGSITGLGGYAIDSTASTVASQIDNRGFIGGAVALSAGSSLNNSGLFTATGTSGFGGGTFTNTGVVNLAGAATRTDAIAATFGNVSTFTNAGVIDVRSQSAASSLTIAGNYVGNQGTVLLNASTQANTSDRLVITGNASGTTAVGVTNLTPGVAFARSPTLIQVAGTVAPNAFTLASAQNFGTLEAVLLTEGGQQGSTVSLGAVPTAVGLSGTTAVVAARSIATQGSTAVLDRVTQLRGDAQRAAANGGSAAPALSYAGDTQYAALVSKDPIAPNLVAPAPAPASNVKPAVWARAFGDLERRSGFSNISFGGLNISRDLGYSQATGGVLAGTDVVISGLTAPDDGLILGVMGGYTLASVRLNQGAGRQDYDGGTVGAYATYLKGGFFSDLLFKSDILGLDITAPGIRQATGLVNYNVLGNIGYRFDLPHALYIEPTAGLEYVATVFDRTPTLAPGTVPLQDGDALRGRIGTRLGTEFIENNIRVEPSITGLIYDTFTESGTTATFGGGTRITGLTNVGKVRGEIQASINFLNLSTGLSGFLRADYRIGDDLVGGGGKAGLRYQW
ncbi:autotransporter outer membrane beta-barrel domain-containing protein [Methylobacterium sp. J-078]|uniref:autotransporter outer membrane beta-barrel domain-containing protein n=1 Tax=Methylobacterium sp. J-078 TaxID=2836657 RepID=UPI001FB908B9|nr:autotransporter outer membrane beta-barrel domain-containing protein [Methylobacterium sp. J-078]MCJ2043887.1 autotransporter outer membrane beta-barrel domain-containing protein [Methylobacterium sp. J-078]